MISQVYFISWRPHWRPENFLVPFFVLEKICRHQKPALPCRMKALMKPKLLYQLFLLEGREGEYTWDIFIGPVYNNLGHLYEKFLSYSKK